MLTDRVFLSYIKEKNPEVPGGINSAITLDDIEFRGILFAPSVSIIFFFL